MTALVKLVLGVAVGVALMLYAFQLLDRGLAYEQQFRPVTTHAPNR